MAYLSNAAVNRLNIHSALHMLAWNLGGNFFLVFLVSQGFSPVMVLLSVAFMMALRFCMRPVILYVAPRIGLHLSLLLGNLCFALQYLFLIPVDGVNAKFFVYCVAFGFADIFYWCTYHAVYAIVGDEHHRGKQIGVRQALTLLSSIFAPLAGGWLLQHLGPKAAFGCSALLQLVAALPLLRMPALPVARKAPPQAFKPQPQGMLLFLADGWLTVGLGYAWMLLLFTAAHDNFATFGGVIAVAGIAAAVGTLFLGHWLDSGRTRRIVILNVVMLSVDLILRASVNRTLGMAFALMAIIPLLDIFYSPSLMTAYYNIVAHRPCPLRFQFLAEGCWDIGCALGALAGAGLLALGAAPGWTLIPAILGILAQGWILRGYYAAHRLRLAENPPPEPSIR